MALYEETLTSRAFQALMVIPLLPMLVGLYATYQVGEGFEIMLAVLAITVLVLLEAMGLRVRIYEEGIFISGLIGLFLRKTIPLQDIEWFAVREGWGSCPAKMHFNYPAKACVYLKRRDKWDVSFSTNRPEEIRAVLQSLGIPRGA